MCLISNDRFPKIAKTDIVCYKVLIKDKKSYRTPFMSVFVDITKPFKAKGSSITFHNNNYKRKGYIHVFKDSDRAGTFTTLFIKGVIFSCVIPKGTLYHIFSDGLEYCAKQIIFGEIIYK